MERSTAHYIALGRKFWTVDDLHEPGDGLKKKQPPTRPLQNFQVGEDETLSEASARLEQEKRDAKPLPSGGMPAAPPPTTPPENTQSSFEEWRDSVMSGKRLTIPTAEVIGGYEDQPMRWTRPY